MVPTLRVTNICMKSLVIVVLRSLRRVALVAWQRYVDEKNLSNTLYSGHVASMFFFFKFVYIIFSPFDVVKSRLQALPEPPFPGYNKYTGVMDCVRKCIKEEGYRVFWHGLYEIIN